MNELARKHGPPQSMNLSNRGWFRILYRDSRRRSVVPSVRNKLRFFRKPYRARSIFRLACRVSVRGAGFASAAAAADQHKEHKMPNRGELPIPATRDKTTAKS